MGVFAEVGLIPKVDLGQYDYSKPWAIRGGDADYIAGIAKYAHEISVDQVQTADVVMFKIGRGWSHAAIVSRWPGEIIHAMHGGVIASPATTGRLAGRQVRFWSLFGGT